jgi:hypothetical protein
MAFFFRVVVGVVVVSSHGYFEPAPPPIMEPADLVLTFPVPTGGFCRRSAFDKLPQAFGDRSSPFAVHINGFRPLVFVAPVAPIHKNLPHSALSKKVAYLRQLFAEGVPVVGIAL